MCLNLLPHFVKLRDKDLINLFEDETKLKIPFEATSPLFSDELVMNALAVVLLTT